ncbi:hypothetical protein [Candidatus Burkholderia verschuerenii]|uniref:hypothetical protein n=1 Tax=Candidatus Burkholderia verschuerenii TaxID=242163 RepID=UPI001E3E61F9|nr:hypothetical protein [Candidatus Burkholderia verschuerenii]
MAQQFAARQAAGLEFIDRMIAEFACIAADGLEGGRVGRGFLHRSWFRIRMVLSRRAAPACDA